MAQASTFLLFIRLLNVPSACASFVHLVGVYVRLFVCVFQVFLSFVCLFHYLFVCVPSFVRSFVSLPSFLRLSSRSDGADTVKGQKRRHPACC